MTKEKFNEKEIRFLNYARVGHLATHAKTRKVRNLREHKGATLILDQYSEDWMRHVAVMMTGIVEIIEKGADFERAKALLIAKFQQYQELFPIHEGESVIMCFKPTKVVSWDYIAGEL